MSRAGIDTPAVGPLQDTGRAFERREINTAE
jgi:hypothetical protein